MTSTNDGKDVKSIQTSGQKGKSYFIELYKSLEAQLNAEASFTDSVTHLCSAWRHVHKLCLHSAPSTHPHLISWIQRHTARTVLQSEWQKEIKDEQPKLEGAIDEFTQQCQNGISARNGAVLPWERQLLARAAWFKSILSNLWGHPVLKALSNLSGERPSTAEVLEWLREERGIMFAARVRQLALSKRTEDIALTLVTAVMDLVRVSREVLSDLELVDENQATPERKNAGPTFEGILSTEAGFSEVWDLLTDIELVLLHKSDKDNRLIELAKQMPLTNGYQVAERLMGRLESAPREKKLWKNVKEVATVVTQLTIARCMVIPSCVGPVRTILHYCGRALARCCHPTRLPRAAATLAAPAASARHLHTLASALQSQFANSDEFKPFVVELYVRAITSGMNELEKLKMKPEYEEKEARATELTLATWFIQLGNILGSSARMKYECILTAFSVHPSPSMFDKIKSAPPLPPVAIDIQPKQETSETPSEFGSWACDSRTQTNFVKTSEHLNMAQTQYQANVLSTAILNEGEALGLDQELCQDIIVLLSGPRVKTLSWDVDRKVLLSNCCSYMERCVYGTRAITTELLYLNLDPQNYQHLPEDLSDEDDVYYGIEKGYEQHLAAEPEPVQIWESEYYDPERTNSAASSYEDSLARRIKKDKDDSSESDSDPLSMVADKKEKKKKERPHSKERSKERKKKPKDTDKSKVAKDVKEKDKEPAEKKKVEPKEKKKKEPKEKKIDESKEKKKDETKEENKDELKDEKKEKKERKKREKKEKKPKNPLIGVKVPKVSAEDAANLNICITHTDMDSRGKPSLLAEGSDEKVVYDGQFSMDEIKSPEKSKEGSMLNSSLDVVRQRAAAAIQKAQNQFAKSHGPNAARPHIPNMSRSQQAFKNEVKKNIKKLIQFRRQKMSELAKPMTSQSNSAVAATSPHFAVGLRPNVNLSKEQHEQLNAMKGEVKTYKSSFSPPKDLKISASCSRVQPFNPAYSRKPRPTLIDTPPSNEALNLSQPKPVTLNHNLNQQNQGITMPQSPAVSQTNDSTHLSSYEKFLRELRRDANAGFDMFPKPQVKKQMKPISKVTPVIPQTMNLATNMTETVSNAVETEHNTNLNTQHAVKKTKPKKNKPKLCYTPTTANLNVYNLVKTEPGMYNPVKTESGLTSTVQNVIKTETRMTPTILNMVNTESKATPTMHAIIKQEPLISQQCAKPIVQAKKVENAPNTFARLSYMHKNKLTDKTKQLVDPNSALHSSISEELDRRIEELNATKMKMKALNNQTEFNLLRASAAPKMVKAPEPPRVEVQSIENLMINDTMNRNHPLLLTILKNAGVTVKSTNVPTEKPVIPKQQNTALTEKDQQELRNLLGQQNLLNRPSQLLKTNTQQCNILHTQFVNNPTKINTNKYPIEPTALTMYRSSTPKPMPVQEQPAAIENKDKVQIRFDKPSFDLAVISDTTIKKTTAMVQSKVQLPPNMQPKTKPKRVRQPKSKVKPDNNTNEPVLEVNNAITKIYVPKPPVSTPQFREDIPEQDWTKVLDAIRSHNTPSRGPKALDMLLNKDSFEKVIEMNQRIASATPVNRVDSAMMHAPVATQVNSTITLPASSKSSASNTYVQKPEIKRVQDKPKVPSILSSKKSAPLNAVPLHSNVTKKAHTKELNKVVDPFISGIPNSDYEILEELMDDDLRQEIGELLSDEEGYKAPVELKGLKNNGNQIIIKRKKPDPTPLTIPSVVNTPISITQPQKSKPQIISNEKVDFGTLSRSLIGSKLIRQNANIVSQDNVIYNVNNTIPSTSVMSTPSSTMFFNAAPTPPAQNMVIIDPYGMSRNVRQTYIPMTNTPNLVYQQFTAPIASQIIIRPTVSVIYNNPEIVPSDVPIMHIPETTHMPVESMQTNFPVPDLKTFDLPIVEQTGTLTDKPLETSNVKMLKLVRKEKNTPAGVVNSKVPDKVFPKTTAPVSINIQQSTTAPKLTTKIEVSSKYGERKVLSEVQDKFTKANLILDSKGPEKHDPMKNINQILLELEKNKEIRKNQERLAMKRLAIINRNVNNRSCHPVIPLTYSPLRVYKATVKVEENMTVLNKNINICFDGVKISKLEDSLNVSHNATSQVSESSISNSKENKDSCRRILLRSSNKVESKVISIEKTQRLVGQKTKVRLKDVETTKSQEIGETYATAMKLGPLPVLIENAAEVHVIPTSKVPEGEKLSNIPAAEAKQAAEEISKFTRTSNRILDKKVKKTKEEKLKSDIISTQDDCSAKQSLSFTNNKAVQNENEFNVGNNIPVPAATKGILDIEEALLGAMIPKPNEIDDKSVAKQTTKEKTFETVNSKTIDVTSKEVNIKTLLMPEICDSKIGDQLKGSVKVINEEKSSTQNIDTEVLNKQKCSEGKVIIVTDTKNEEKISEGIILLNNVNKIRTNSHESVHENHENLSDETASKPIPVASAYEDLITNKITELVDDIESAISAITESTLRSPILETPIENEIILEEKGKSEEVNMKEILTPKISTDNASCIENKITTVQSDLSNTNNVTALPKASPKESDKKLTNKINNKNKILHTSLCNKKGPKNASKIATVKKMKVQNTNVAKNELEFKKLKKLKQKIENSSQSPAATTGDEFVCEKLVIESTENNTSLKTHRMKQITNELKESNEIVTNVCDKNEPKASVDSVKLQGLNSDRCGVKPNDPTAINKKGKEEKSAVTSEKSERNDLVKDNQESSEQKNNTYDVLLDKRIFLNSVLDENDEDVILLSSESDLDSNTIKPKSNNLPCEQGPAAAAVFDGGIPSINDIPQSFKDSIQIKEIPLPGNTIPNKRCVRITLPNKKVFKATVHGKINVSFDTLFEEPALKNLLLSSMHDKKRYTLVNIKQLSTVDHKILETVVREVGVYKNNYTSKAVEYVNLISDDEDEPIQKITTTSGSFKVKSIDQNTLKKHQQKLSQKCEIKLRRCDDKPKKEALVEALLKDLSVNTEPEVIEINDSSSDGESFTDQTEIDELKNLLLKDFGVADDTQNKLSDDVSSEILLATERPPRTRKSKYHRERDQIALSVETNEQSSSQVGKSESNKTTFTTKESEEVAKQTNYSQIIKHDCFVQLINCDDLVNKMRKDQQMYENSIRHDDEVFECTIGEDDTPVISRRGSFSILNEIDLLDRPLTPADRATSPVMRVFETIHALRELDNCEINSPIMEAHEITVSFQDISKITETPTLSYKLENTVLCQSEWMETKRGVRMQSELDNIRTIDEIFLEIVQNKIENSTDCETDAATDLSTIDNENVYMENKVVSSLKSIMLKYFQDISIIYEMKPSGELIDLLKTPLKRKSQDPVESACNKVLKTLIHPSSTQKLETERGHKKLELQDVSTLQHDTVDLSKNALIPTQNDKSMEIVNEENTCNQDTVEAIVTKLNHTTEISNRNDKYVHVSDTSKDEALLHAQKISVSCCPETRSPDAKFNSEAPFRTSDILAGLDKSNLNSSSNLREASHLPIPVEDEISVSHEDQCNSNTANTFQDAVENTETEVSDSTLTLKNINGSEETEQNLKTRSFNGNFVETDDIPKSETYDNIKKIKSKMSPLSTTTSMLEISDTTTEDVSFVLKEDNTNCIIDKDVKRHKSFSISPNVDVAVKLDAIVVKTKDLSSTVEQDPVLDQTESSTLGYFEVKEVKIKEDTELISEDATSLAVKNEYALLMSDTVSEENKAYVFSKDSLQTSKVEDSKIVNGSCENLDVDNTFILDITKEATNISESLCNVVTPALKESFSVNCNEDSSATITTNTTSRSNFPLQDKSDVSNVTVLPEDISITNSKVKLPKLPVKDAVGLNVNRNASVNEVVSQDLGDLPVKDTDSCLDLMQEVEVKSQLCQSIMCYDVIPDIQESSKIKKVIDVQIDKLDNCATLPKAETILLTPENSAALNISTCSTETSSLHVNSKEYFEGECYSKSTCAVIEDITSVNHDVLHNVTTERFTNSDEIVINSIQESNQKPSVAVENEQKDSENKLELHSKNMPSDETQSINRVANKIDVGVGKVVISDSECAHKENYFQYCDNESKVERLDDKLKKDTFKSELKENKKISENNCVNVANINDNYNHHEVHESTDCTIDQLDVQSEVTIKAIDMDENYVYETEIVVETQTETDYLDEDIKLLPEQDQSEVVKSGFKKTKYVSNEEIIGDCLNDEEIIVEKTIKEVDCNDDVFENNATLVYKDNSGVVLKGIQYEDPEIGTCYVFPLEKSSDESGTIEVLNSSLESTIEVFQEEEIEADNSENSTDLYEEIDLKVIEPKLTYSKRNLKRKSDMRDVTCTEKRSRKNSRSKETTEIKIVGKKYRKSKNIDMPKMSASSIEESGNTKDFKRRLHYYNTVGFSYAVAYSTEFIDASELLNKWPIEGPIQSEIFYENEHQCALFIDLDRDENLVRDPLRFSFVEEIEAENEKDYPNWQSQETNFNMGFGERSDRVIQNLDIGTISKFSAATLSDVKHYQPCLLSENYSDSRKDSNFCETLKQEQLQTIKRYLTYMQLREKVRSFFRNSTFELLSGLNKEGVKGKNKNYDESTFPFDLFYSNCIEPFPTETIVQVVQVGQLPVSAAAQNPVTCDPRVTQVSNASPSQCSVVNSPHDDSQSEIKTEYTELTTADLSLPLVDEYEHHNQTLPGESQNSTNMLNTENIPIQTEIVKSEVKIELVEESPEEKENSEISEANNHVNNVDYSHDSNNINPSVESEFQALFDSDKQDTSQNFVHPKSMNGSSEKTDQIAHAMNAAGITTSETANTRAQALVNILTQKLRPGSIITTPNSMSLQQALASILPPPLNQTSSPDNNQQGQNTVTPQVLHIVQGKNASGNQITLVDNTQQSVITTPNATPVLHIVQNKAAAPGQNANGSPSSQPNTFSGLSLVDAGLQQGGNQLLHIVNTGNQKNNNAGQLLKRVNLLTNLANVQGSNEQKMVQFVCKSADGKSIQLNAPHQRSMVLRLQPIETPNVQSSTPKPAETNQDISPIQPSSSATNKDSAPTQQEIKSRSVYEENYAKFIQSSSNKPTLLEKSNSLPKFNQAFGKAVFQDGNQKQNEMNSNNLPSVNTSTDSPECSASDNTINLDHIGRISSPPLLIRKEPTPPTQSQQNLVQQIKQTITPMNIQTMHGGVIYTRQIPVNIGGGQTINLITVPSTDLIDESGQKQQVNQGETIEPSIIKIVPQSQPRSNAEVSDDMNNDNAQQGTPQPQPVLTQMRIKLPMLSKAPQMVSGARVVRPSFFQIQRNVIGGGNQAVYQQLVLTAAPPLGQQTIRLPQAQTRQIKIPENQSSTESQMSSSTLEQLREFDMVLEQVKERSTVQPNANSGSNFKLHTPSTDTTDSPVTATSTSAETTQVLYSIGSSQPLNVTYVNRKPSISTTTTSSFVISPDSSGIADSPTSSSHSHMPHTSTSEASSGETTHHKPVKISSKSKSRPKSSSHSSNSMKLNTAPPKTSSQKPLEDEQTTQRILYILAEYKEQVENSPDKDKPAPRRRTNPPSNPGSSKRKKSSSRRSGRDISPIGDDTCRTMGSEDSSCGTSQGDCTESCMDSHSPQDSPRKVPRKLAFEQDSPTTTQPRQQPQRNVIVADGQTITVARGAAGKPATAVLMPANYILPVSMVKGGQQIAIVTNRGPKLLTVGGGEGGATNALLLQRLIGPAGLKPVLTRPGVRHVRLPTAALHNLQAFNLATATSIQPPDSTASPAPDPPSDLMDSNRSDHSPWTDREDVKPDRASSPDDSEPWNMPSSADPHDYSYEETVRSDNMDRTVLDPIQDRYSPDMEAQRIFDKMFDVDAKKSYIVDSPRCAYDIDASDCDDKPYQVVHRKEGGHRQTRLSHVSASALRHKYAILEHELRLQKSLSEECEDLGVDSPSASELFPEAELLFAASPAQDHGPDTPQHSHTPQPTIPNQSVIQPDIDDQIATDQLLPRHNVPEERQDLDVNLGLEDVGIVTVSGDGMQATIALDHEEFARSHPNTTFHSEPTEDVEVQPFTIAGLKSRHITSTIFHSNRVPATVLMTAPQTTVISQANAETSRNPVKYADIDNMIHAMPSTHTNTNNVNLPTVLVKDEGLTRFDNILTDTRELHLSNTASAVVHSVGNATQVIRRVCYDDSKRERDFLMDEPDQLIAGDDAKMIAEDSSRDATMESMGRDDDNSSPERHAELFWESNSASERSEGRRPLDFSSDSEKCCKSPSYDETNSTDSSGVGTHMRLDSVIKEARGIDRSASAEGSSADDTHPPLRTYPPKRLYHNPGAEMERSLSGKTRAGERSPDIEVRRRASGRGVVKRGCHCCNGSPAPPRPKKPRQRKPTMDFTN